MPLPSPPLLVTHGGRFHCDEVLACAVLRLALGLHAPGVDHVLLRTRRAEEISRGDVVWDVGLVHDAARARFDHHQSGAPTRPDGTPYSSAGLVWQVHGVAAVAALLRPRGAESMAPAIAAELDATLILRVDEVDNGVSARGPVVQDGLGLAALVGDCNPPWDAQDAPAPERPGAPPPRTAPSRRRWRSPAACCAVAWSTCAPDTPRRRWCCPRTPPVPTRASWCWSAACPGRPPPSRTRCP